MAKNILNEIKEKLENFHKTHIDHKDWVLLLYSFMNKLISLGLPKAHIFLTGDVIIFFPAAANKL